MRKETRAAYKKYVARVAELNGIDEADTVAKFSVAPSVEQTLEEKIQESSEFLQQVSVVPVVAQSGDKVGVGVTRPLAGRTNTKNGERRTPSDPTDTTDDGGYFCRQTNYDHAIPYAKLDQWRHKPNFQTLLRDVILKQQGRDRIMIGFNGTSAAATTDRAANPLLQDVNEGWLHKIRTHADERVLDDGALTPGAEKAIYVAADVEIVDVIAAKRENEVMARFRQAFAQYEAELLAMPGIRTNRLAKTHGQLLAFLDAMRAMLPLTDEQQAATAKFIVEMATERQLAVNSEDPIVSLFWERFDYLEENEDPAALSGHINHHRRHAEGMIAVRLNEMEARCAEKRLALPTHAELIRALKTSKSRRFIEQTAVNSRNDGVPPVRCWVFHDRSRATSTNS